MALNFVDRLLTIVATATVTSAAWIVAGSAGLGGFGHGLALHGGGAPPPSALPSANPSSVAAPQAHDAQALIIPVAGVAAGQLTDTFNDTRSGGRPHQALDIMAPAGSTVLAAASGTVEKLFLSKAGGNTIYVRLPGGTIIHYYAHLQGYAPGLHEGQQVGQGEALGKVGSTGDANAAGPHLHFQILRTGPGQKWWGPAVPVDPYPLLKHNT